MKGFSSALLLVIVTLTGWNGPVAPRADGLTRSGLSHSVPAWLRLVSNGIVGTSRSVEATSRSSCLRCVAAPSDLNTVVFFPPFPRGQWISQHYLGLSLELGDLCQLLSHQARNRAVVNLLNELQLGAVRMGESSQDYANWVPDGTASCRWPHIVLTKRIVNQFAEFARKFPWSIIWGLNLGADQPVRNANEAFYVMQVLGAKLLAFGVGNEPDWFYGIRPRLRLTPFKAAEYEAEWDSYRDAIRALAPAAPLLGPSTSSPTFGNSFYLYQAFVLHEPKGLLKYATEHYYPTLRYQRGIESASVSNLLSAALACP